MSADEVKAAMGEPNDVVVHESGNVIWTYPNNRYVFVHDKVGAIVDWHTGKTIIDPSLHDKP
jgi:hypothetical protein